MRSAVTELVEAPRDERQIGQTQDRRELLPATPEAPAEGEQSNSVDESRVTERAAKRAALLEFAVFASLMAGATGIVRATQMDRPLDIVVCLVGSVAGCSLVSYLYFRRD